MKREEAKAILIKEVEEVILLEEEPKTSNPTKLVLQWFLVYSTSLIRQ